MDKNQLHDMLKRGSERGLLWLISNLLGELSLSLASMFSHTFCVI